MFHMSGFHSSYCVSCRRKKKSQLLPNAKKKKTGTKVQSAYVQSERARTVQILIAMYANERVPTLVQRALEADHDELERVRRLRAYIVRHFRHVRVVQRRVHLVEDEERAGLVAEERERRANTGQRAPTFLWGEGPSENTEENAVFRTCGWRIEGPARRPSFRRRTAAPCLGSASWGAWRDI